MAKEAEGYCVNERSAAIDRFLAGCGWAGARRQAIAGDASFRRYERITAGQRNAVLMDAPPEKEDTRPFTSVAEFLLAQGYSAPAILARDTAQGFLLLEDLGDDLFSRVLAADIQQEEELYRGATEVLVDLHRQAARGALPEVPAYDAALLLREVKLFSEWALPEMIEKWKERTPLPLAGGGQGRVSLYQRHPHLDPPPQAGEEGLKIPQVDEVKILAKEYEALWTELLERIPPLPPVPVLRDFHADNLLWLPGRGGVKRVGLLDFQDAVLGSPAYDLVSFLEDARRDVAPATAQRMLEYYAQETGIARDAFAQAYAMLGAQRNLKIIGIFTRLHRRDGKPHYRKFLPRVFAHLKHDLEHPALATLKAWMNNHLPLPSGAAFAEAPAPECVPTRRPEPWRRLEGRGEGMDEISLPHPALRATLSPGGEGIFFRTAP